MVGALLSAEGKTCGAAGSGSHIGRGVRTEGAAGVRHTLVEMEGVSGRPEAPGLPGLRTPPGWLNCVYFC